MLTGAAKVGDQALPSTLLGLVIRVSGSNQAWLSALSIIVFVADAAPIEVQRRLVNAAVEGGDVQAVALLASLFALLALAHGLLNLTLNIYRSWASESAVRWLRNEISRQAQDPATPLPSGKAGGVEIAMVIAEADPIGGFVGSSFSEPLLQGGIMIAVFSYLVILQPLMALIGIVVFLPQFVIVPVMQGAINRRLGARVWILRKISVALVDTTERTRETSQAQEAWVEHVFQLNMGIYKFKFTLNFIMNILTSIGTAAILGVGGYYVIAGQTEIGTVVAFVSGLSKIASPWGDLINWYRDFRVTQERYRLVVGSLGAEHPINPGSAPI